MTSVISNDMDVLGNIICEGHVDIDGSVEGSIKADIVTVRKNGNINGEIFANTVHNFGRIKGMIRSTNVVLFKDCIVEGIIMHENIRIEEGASVDGKFKKTEKLGPTSFEKEEASAENLLENLKVAKSKSSKSKAKA